MKSITRILIPALLVLAAPAMAFADFYTQLPAPFTPTLVGGLQVNLSQFDTGAVTAPDIRDFATSYDDFTFANSGVLDSVAWIGKYDAAGAGLAPNFRVSLYANTANAPGALLQTFSVAGASTSETAIAGQPQFFQYQASVTPTFVVNANTKYWMSVVAELDYGTRGWGWAFSSVGGDDRSFQDFAGPGQSVPTRFFNAGDFSFSANISAIPEPASCLLFAGVLGTVGVARRFRRKKSSVKA